MTTPDANLEESEVLTAAASTRHAAASDDVCAWSLEENLESPPRDEGPQPVPRRAGRSVTVALVALLTVAAAACATLLAFGLPPFRQSALPAQMAAPPTADASNTPSAPETTGVLCRLYTAVHAAIVLNTHMANPDNTTAGAVAVAANARLALFSAGVLLRQGVQDNPDAPLELREDLQEMSKTTTNLSLGYLEEANDPALDPLRHALDDEISTADNLCKSA